MKLNRKAFTLIELLVAVVIIGIVAALFSGAIKSARDAAKGATCINNQRGVLLGAFMYAEEHNDKTPNIPELGPYIDNEDIFACPSDKRPNLGIDNSSYSPCEGTPESLPPIGSNGASTNTAVYVESDEMATSVDEWANVKFDTDLQFRHGNGNIIVISFADGHVEALNKSEVPYIYRRSPTEQQRE